MVYELHRGEDTPTIEMVVKDWNFSVPQPDAEAVLAARRDDLTEQQVHLLQMALGDAEIIEDATAALGIAVADLRRQLRRDRVLGPMPGLFDAEMSAAVPDTIVTSDAARATLEGYSALQLGEPTRARLSEFVETHFEGPHLARLLAIVEAMTDEEVAAVYADAAQSVQSHTLEFQQNSIDLMLYACQEDVPYNTMEGYRQTVAEQPFDVTAFSMARPWASTRLARRSRRRRATIGTRWWKAIFPRFQSGRDGTRRLLQAGQRRPRAG